MDAHILLTLVEVMSVTLCVTFPIYLVTILAPYLARRRDREGDPYDCEWHLFVPCRDEEAVIAGTLDYLRENLPQAHVWVIDDDSDDATAAIVAERAAEDVFVHLVQRRRPDARLGKGEALNAAYRALGADPGLGPDRTRIIVGVVDADGRPAPNCLSAVAGRFFDDPRIGAVQIEVRMINRDVHANEPGRGRLRNFYSRQLVRMQDLEFRAPMAALQHARRYSGSVSLGGNGQFARLDALDDLCRERGRPWTGRLLEDYELGIHLMLVGHVNAFCAETHVNQEALFSTRRYITQRTRWAQGVMQCFKYLGAAWTSPHVSALGVVEIAYYLMQPWLQLVGALLFPLPFLLLGLLVVHDPHAALAYLAHGGWEPLALMAALAVSQFAVWGPLYRWKCEPEATWPQALGWGFAYIFYLMFLYIISWKALWRMLRRRGGWAKTRRNAEVVTSGPIAQEM